MSEEIDYAARVQRGIALLDQKWPAWAMEIDLNTLDIEWGDRCMTAQFAQLHGNANDDTTAFEEGQALLDLSNQEYELHGFNIDPNTVGSAAGIGYAALNGLWKAAIVRRRAQGQEATGGPEAGA